MKRSNIVKVDDSAFFVVNEADFTVAIAGYDPSLAQQTISSGPEPPTEESQPPERGEEEAPLTNRDVYRALEKVSRPRANQPD